MDVPVCATSAITRRMQCIVGAKPSPACSLKSNTVYTYVRTTYDYLAFTPAESLVWGFTPINKFNSLAIMASTRKSRATGSR